MTQEDINDHITLLNGKATAMGPGVQGVWGKLKNQEFDLINAPSLSRPSVQESYTSMARSKKVQVYRYEADREGNR